MLGKISLLEWHIALETFHSLSNPIAAPKAHGFYTDLGKFSSSSVSQAWCLSNRLQTSHRWSWRSWLILWNALDMILPTVTKLQKWDKEVDAYNMIHTTITFIKSVHRQIDMEFCKWFQMADVLILPTQASQRYKFAFQHKCVNVPFWNASLSQ